MPDLSVLIPSRNEPYLRHTVLDILKNARADTEVIVILDGGWPVEPLQQHEKVTLVYHPQSVGQRAATNEAARLSEAKYIAKADAHCAFDEGFDAKLIQAAEELGPDVTQIPSQKNLHVFDLVCENQQCDWRSYQCPTPKECPKCKGKQFRKEIVWKPRRGVTTVAWRFDETLHFQYAGEMGKRPELRQGDFIETMSCLGAFFFMSRERFWQLDGFDQGHGSWGNYGTELGCKAWLSGGRMVTNTRTWFSHFFRTSGGDLSFPYQIHGSDQEKARAYSRKLWLNNGWSKQIRPLSWMVEHFWPVPGWSDAARAKVAEAGAAFTSARSDGLAVPVPVGSPPSTRGLAIGGAANALGIGVADSTGAAPAALAVPSVGLERQEMADGAVRLPRVQGGGAWPAQGVVPASSESEMRGVNAAPIVADEMVKLRNATADSVRDGRDRPCVEEAMNQDVATRLPAADMDLSVTGAGQRPSPQPAASAGVDDDLGEDSGQRLPVEVRDREKLAVSHASASGAEVGSGPGGATTSSGPLIVQEGTHETKAHEDRREPQHQREPGSSRDSDAPLRDEDGRTRAVTAGVSLASPHAAGGDTAEARPHFGKATAVVLHGLKEVVPTGDLHGLAVVPPAPNGAGAGSPTKGILYYSHETADPELLEACRAKLRKSANGIPIVSVTLKPVDLGFNVVLPREPGILTMFYQQLIGLKVLDADIVYFAENDCLYPQEHFDFVPPREDAYYYDISTYKVDAATGRTVHYITQQTSGLCAYRNLLVEHYRKRVERVEREGYSRAIGFEPGCHRPPRGIDNFPAISWRCAVPIVDVRHRRNLTPSRWDRSRFRSQRACQGWTESDSVPGWGVTKGRFDEFLRELGKA